MRRTVIVEDLYEYQFEPEPGKAYGFNLYVLLNGPDALLIDTAYAPQAAAVLADLRAQRRTVKRVLISHFHPDHITGLKTVPDVHIWGSRDYPLTLHDAPSEIRNALPPVEVLDDGDVRRFGTFTLAFRSAPGHTPCSLQTTIDGKVVHVADNLMAANDGTPILPWAPFDGVGAHVRSLERLAATAPEVVLLAHGKRIAGGAAIRSEIEDRLRYLRAVRDGKGDRSVEEATAGCSRRFLCEHWHIRRGN
jgi:glyoxylase-like metal-dependent hydrolase (beta-lactamase superfamily II)